MANFKRQQENLNKQLREDMASLSEVLEDEPDKWFDNPCGWLLRPSYKRDAQKRKNLDSRSSFSGFSMQKLMTGSAYKRRWFVLDKENKKIKYFRDETKRNESGFIPLMEIIAVKISTIFDAPQFALDLISHNMHFTIGCFSRQIMVRWAFAIDRSLKALSSQSFLTRGSSTALILNPRDSVSSAALLGGEDDDTNAEDNEITEFNKRWHRFSVKYPTPGPLMLNVLGRANQDDKGNILNYSIYVDSFEKYPNGKPGVSETGAIAVGDIVIGVNDVDLSDSQSFLEAMEAIQKASWPKSLHFIRDKYAIQDKRFAECWAFVYFPHLKRVRRRYITLCMDTVNFMKPDPGGSVERRRSSYFPIEHISYLRPFTDMNLPSDRRHMLRLACKAGAVVMNEQDDTETPEAVPVEVLDLFFREMRSMQMWSQCLANPHKRCTDITLCKTLEIPIAPHETIQSIEANKGPSMSTMGIRSPITGQFSVRVFDLKEGTLCWSHPDPADAHGISSPSQSTRRTRRLFLGDEYACNLINIKSFENKEEKLDQFRFQLKLQTVDETIVMGMSDKETLDHWVAAVSQVVAKAPKRASLKSPALESGASSRSRSNLSSRTQTSSSGPGSTKFSLDDPTAAVNMQLVVASPGAEDFISGDQAETIQGFLFKKHNNPIKLSLGKKLFSKYWFVLKGFELVYFRSNEEVGDAEEKPLGSIDLKVATAVRICVDRMAPQFAMEVNTSKRVYVLVAEDEEEQMKWLDALDDTLQAVKVAALSEDADLFAKFEAIKREIVFEGGLSLKGTGKILALTSWKERYFVIAHGTLSYYEARIDVFDKKRPKLGEISLVAITCVQSSDDEACAAGCGFEVHAHVREKGNADGIRVFTLEARTANLCTEWMDQICRATGALELKFVSEVVGYVSERSAAALQKRDSRRRASVQTFVVGLEKEKGGDAADGEGERRSVGSFDDDESDEEAEAASKRRSSILDIRRSSFYDVAGRGSGGRGMGRGSRSSLGRARSSTGGDAVVDDIPPPLSDDDMSVSDFSDDEPPLSPLPPPSPTSTAATGSPLPGELGAGDGTSTAEDSRGRRTSLSLAHGNRPSPLQGPLGGRGGRGPTRSLSTRRSSTETVETPPPPPSSTLENGGRQVSTQDSQGSDMDASSASSMSPRDLGEDLIDSQEQISARRGSLTANAHNGSRPSPLQGQGGRGGGRGRGRT